MAAVACPQPPGGFPLKASSQSSSARLVHSGNVGPIGGTVGTTLSSGTNTTPSATETYLVEIYVPAPCLVTGIALKNGATVGTDKACAALLDGNGTVLGQHSASGTTTSGASSYQSLAFSTPVLVQPGTYYIAAQFNGTYTRFASHSVGKFGAGKATSTTFGTFTGLAASLPVTFTADLGPMASLY